MPAQYGMPNQVYEPSMGPAQSQQSQGGFLSGLKEFLMGRPEQIQQIAQFDPQQMQALSQLLQMGLSGQGQFDFAPIEQQARTQFQQQTLPSIAERFTSMGGQGSSAFTQALGQAGAGLEQNLAAMKSQYNLQREPLMQNLLRMGLAPRYDTMARPGTSGLLGGLLGGVSQGIGQAGSMYGLSKLLPLLM